jgi:hypothetical protein
MSKQKMLTSGTLAALCLMAVCSLHAKAAPAQDGPAGSDGMVVVRDPQTGKMRAPTPAELQALRAKTAQAGAALAAAPRAATLAPRSDGSRGVRLGDKTMVYEVVTRGADGKLSSQCVEGADAAQKALANPPAATSDATTSHAATPHADPRENAHESR